MPLTSLALGTAAPAAAGQTYTVTMANMSYGTIPSGLKVGDTVIWVNRDTVLHTATARDHSFDLRIAPGWPEPPSSVKKAAVFLRKQEPRVASGLFVALGSRFRRSTRFVCLV